MQYWLRMSVRAKTISAILGCLILITTTTYGAYTFAENKLEKKIQKEINKNFKNLKDNDILNEIIDSKINNNNKIIVEKLDKILSGVNESNSYRQVVLKRSLKKQVEKIQNEYEDKKKGLKNTDVKLSDIEGVLDDYEMIKDKNGRIRAYYDTVNNYYMNSLKSQK